MSDKKIFAGGEFLIEDAKPEDIFTPEDFSKEHEMIRETAEDFVAGEVEPHVERLENQDFELLLEIHRKAGELGLLSADLPAEYGGMGLDKVSSTIINEVMGRSGPYTVIFGCHTGIGSLPYLYYGTEEQKQQYLPKLATGEWAGAYCLTEAGSGSDALAALTNARLSEDGKHYILNGTKQFITNAGFATTFCVYAKVDDEHFSGFIVEKGFNGVIIGKEEKKMGSHSSSTCTVTFEDTMVPVENLLHEVGKGHKIAFNTLNLGRWKLGAMVTGGCKGCVTEAVRYANGREQFSTPISSFGVIKNKLARMAVSSYVSESVVYRLAGMIDDKVGSLDEEAKKDGIQNAKAIEEYATECSIAKVLCSENLDYCVDELVQIHGGYGYCAEYPAERHYRDARINRIWEGTNEINRLLIPGTILKRAMQGRLDLMGSVTEIASFLMSYSPMSVKLGDEPLAVQTHMLSMCKKLALMTAGVAVQKFMMELEKEQEVLELVADIIIAVFTMESGLLRAQKAVDRSGESDAEYHIAAVQVYVDEMVPIIENKSRQLLSYIEEGDALKTQLAAVKKLVRYQTLDTITLKRKLADRIIDLESYPF